MNMWRLSSTLLNNHWIKGEITRKISKYFVVNKNKTHKNIWDVAEAVLRGRFIVVNGPIKKKE